MENYLRASIELEKLLEDCGETNVSVEVERQMMRLRSLHEGAIACVHNEYMDKMFNLKALLRESMKEEEEHD